MRLGKAKCQLVSSCLELIASFVNNNNNNNIQLVSHHMSSWRRRLITDVDRYLDQQWNDLLYEYVSNLDLNVSIENAVYVIVDGKLFHTAGAVEKLGLTLGTCS